MLVYGNKIAKALEEKLATELIFSALKKVCFVVFGGNTTTEQFVKMKSRVAERMGIAVDIKKYPKVTSTEEATELVQSLGEKDYDGIVVQLPMTLGIDTQSVLDAIPPHLDIDVLGTVSKESYAGSKINRMPPVAQAVKEILEAHNISLKGKKIVVAGRGRLVGEPISLMLKRMNVPHDIVDIRTSGKEKLSLIKNADIVISGMGVPHDIRPDMIKEGAVLIDAGTSEQGGKLVGDIDPACEKVASLMTPVPGGVGPITIVSLLRNLF
ncbi:MAG: bifunctional 5,10-methylenetetrahydrofolate dehydrogenase/5,10-methenyltetrahydrofolate cyclohydrolase [Candidatus Yonathbacteria bacterium]|nr:bifunctional 5,10-methylenetetrahydrofolate dehydrogenase/5,10-methenyltetrahydrofolate cyclohydrolase [Candidatus Yonathbacteria bacterium]